MCRDSVRERLQIKYYARYMDDMFMIVRGARFLAAVKAEWQEFGTRTRSAYKLNGWTASLRALDFLDIVTPKDAESSQLRIFLL